MKTIIRFLVLMLVVALTTSYLAVGASAVQTEPTDAEAATEPSEETQKSVEIIEGVSISDYGITVASASYTKGYWTYLLGNSTATITGYSGDEANVVIPETVTYLGTVYKVTELSNYLFEEKNMTTVVIPQHVNSLGKGAFRNCKYLKEITINAKNLSDCSSDSASSSYYSNHSVFYNAGTESGGFSVTFGSGVTNIPSYLFSTAGSRSDNTYAHITSVSIPDSVLTIGTCAFHNCFDLKTVQWGNSIQTIGAYAFENCTALQSVTIPSTATSIGRAAFWNCVNLSSITINAKNLNDCPGDSISSSYYYNYSVFYNAGANSNSLAVTFGSTVKEIPAYLFATAADYNYGDGVYAHITSVSIPDNVLIIGACAFYNCFDLNTVKWGNSIQTIGAYAFKNCTSLQSVTIPSTATSIGNAAFWNCVNLSSITINAKNLNDCSSDSVSSSYYSSYSVFYNAGANSNSLAVTFGSTVKEIPAYLFATAADYNYGDGVYAHITSVEISNSIAKIRTSAFLNCYDLTDVYYNGAFEQWSQIDKASGNECLTDAALHYISQVKITKQPEDVYCQLGEEINLTFEAEGEGLTYSWYVKDVIDEKFELSSVTSDVYAPAMTENKSGRYVYCVVTDQYGNKATTDTVRIWLTATITQQPKSVSVANGATAKVTVGAVGDGLTYKWYYKNPGQTKYTYTSSFKGNSYSVTMNDARDGRQVLCRVYDKYGNVVQTNTVKLSMVKTAVQITQQPKSVTVSSGEIAKVTVGAVGDGLSYRWYYKNAGESKYTYTSSFKGSTYQVTMNDARNGRQVLCRVYDKYGNVVQTNTVKLSMKSTALKITRQPTSVMVAEGERATVTVKAEGTGLTYKWYYKDVGSTKFTLTTSFRGSIYYITMTEARAGRQVYCVITDAMGNTVKTNTVRLNME